MNWPRISSGMISGSIALGTSGIQLLKYLTGPFQRIPSTWVKTNVMSARASVTESVEVAAKIARVGISRPKISQRSSESGSGMKPSMLTTQMKIISEATYGNQRPIALCGSPCSATWTCATS